jgi:dynein heavy chain, axonemal
VLPSLERYEDYLKYIEGLPTFGSPELVGLHSNADIAKDISESHALLDTLLLCNSQSSATKGEGRSAEEEVVDLVKAILAEGAFPGEFDEEGCLAKYPVRYE